MANLGMICGNEKLIVNTDTDRIIIQIWNEAEIFLSAELLPYQVKDLIEVLKVKLDGL